MSEYVPVMNDSIASLIPVIKEYPLELGRLDLSFRWGDYVINVIKWHYNSFNQTRLIEDHQHLEYEFHFIPFGKGTVYINGIEYQLHPGYFYLTGPNVVHRQIADNNDRMNEICLHIDIQEAESDTHIPSDEMDDAAQTIALIKQLPATPLIDRFAAMQCFFLAYQALHDNQVGFYTTIRHCLIQMLIRVARMVNPSNQNTTILSRDMNAHRYVQAIQFIQANYNKPITLEDLTNELHISVRQIQRIFQEVSQRNFSQVLEHYRLSKVCDDLKNTAHTVEYMAHKHGFTNSNYLHRVFKKRMNMTPNQYRNLFREAAMASIHNATEA